MVLFALVSCFLSLELQLSKKQREEVSDDLLDYGHKCLGVMGCPRPNQTKRGAHNTANVPLSLKTKIPKLITYPNKPNIYFNFLKSQ